MRPRVVVLLGALSLGWGAPLPAQQQNESLAALRELAQVRAQLHDVWLQVRAQGETQETSRREILGLAKDLDGLKDDLAQLSGSVVAAGFLAAPPPSSDMVGVAKVAVLSPRVVVESVKRHDIVFLKLKRIEAGGLRTVAERELVAAETEIELPLDQNGALYVLEWSTAEGFNFVLALRDGATEQNAATVQVRLLQREGRFVFVGYRAD